MKVNMESLFLILVALLVTGLCVLFLGKFSDYGLSNNTSDWGSFGSYIAGVTTLPLSLFTLYYLYQTYKQSILDRNLAKRRYDHERTLNRKSKKEEAAYDAIREASSFLDESLKQTLSYDGHRGVEVVSFLDIHADPKLAKLLLPKCTLDNIYFGQYRVSVAKPFFILYDFLYRAERQHGISPLIQFYKIKYQWLINIHNAYDLEQIAPLMSGLSNYDIEQYFYSNTR